MKKKRNPYIVRKPTKKYKSSRSLLPKTTCDEERQKKFPHKIQTQVDAIDEQLRMHQSNAHLITDFFIGIKTVRVRSGIKSYQNSEANDRYFLGALRNLREQIKPLLKKRIDLTYFY